jgi:hypothetical protein
MARRRRNKRKSRIRNMGNPKTAAGGRAVKVRRRSNEACTTKNQKAIE